MFLCGNRWKLWTFSILYIWNKLSGKRILFSKKLEYRLLVESTKIEKVSFPFKNGISESNVKTNGMVSTKWTYHKERILPVTTLLFSKIFVSVYKPLTKSWFDVPITQINVHIHTFRKSWSFIWGCFFFVSILKLTVSDW